MPAAVSLLVRRRAYDSLRVISFVFPVAYVEEEQFRQLVKK